MLVCKRFKINMLSETEKDMAETPIEKTKSTIVEFSKIIPELYFDIICRVIPGIIFVTIFITTISNCLSGKWYYDVTVIIAVAYSIALSLDCFSQCLLHQLSMYWSWKK